MEANNELFSEVQRFSPWLSGIMVLIGVGVMCLVLILPFSRLETKIDEDGITVRHFPAQLKHRKYVWADIEKIYVREYSPIWEYGGWGLKGIKDDRVLNVRGNKGLQLRFRDGKRLLIGTGKPEEIRSILTKIGHYTGE